jgi:hypothetical protein
MAAVIVSTNSSWAREWEREWEFIANSSWECVQLGMGMGMGLGMGLGADAH